MKFAGRTPSAAGGRSNDYQSSRAREARAVAWRVALAAFILCAAAAFFRGKLGNNAPWPAYHSLQVLTLSPPLPNFQPRATLQAVAPGWWETFAGVAVFGGQWLQSLGPRGMIWLMAFCWLAFLLWFALAQMGNWRAPSLPLVVLLSLQLCGALYYAVSFCSPARTLQTPFIAFDFHTHTTRSNGLLSPQQQINWHRARGFSGLAFTDTNRMMPASTFSALQAANPDMILLNGSEWHGRDAHLLLFGLPAAGALPSPKLSAREALSAAKRAGALVIVAHPWYPGRHAPQDFLQWGADGFEAWNGTIWDVHLARLIKTQKLIGTTATDTLSKSGARALAWTILPRGLHDEANRAKEAANVQRALRMRKTAAVFALSAGSTPQNWDTEQEQLRSPRGVFIAARQAWDTLTATQRITTLLGLLGALALFVGWGARGAQRVQQLHGPERAMGFLRRRRLGPRTAGVFLILFAFAGTVAGFLLGFGGNFKSDAVLRIVTPSPLHAILIWLACDALFFYGRFLWRRKQ